MMSAIGTIPKDWLRALGSAASPERLAPIVEYVATKRRQPPGVLPDADRVFAALAAAPFDEVRAVILGQDPYPKRTHAMGLAFSVPRTVTSLPRSLKNIHDELAFDLDLASPSHGSLEAWAQHGVLLLNTTLTTQEGGRAAHDPAVWADLTNAIISVVAAKRQPVAFLLWGMPAKAKVGLIDEHRHVVVRSTHPSPLSQGGFLKSRPFSRANDGLRARRADPIDWSLDD
jgi:uracil-DNA glycosylase